MIAPVGNLHEEQEWCRLERGRPRQDQGIEQLSKVLFSGTRGGGGPCERGSPKRGAMILYDSERPMIALRGKPPWIGKTCCVDCL
jgi:hypothetical protein